MRTSPSMTLQICDGTTRPVARKPRRQHADDVAASRTEWSWTSRANHRTRRPTTGSNTAFAVLPICGVECARYAAWR
jgi:hypothetical protein